MRSVLVKSFFQLAPFEELCDQAHQLRGLQEKYKSSISSHKYLPEEYLAALLRFRHYLNQASKGALNQLKTAVAALPPLRCYFVREVPVSASSSVIDVMSKSESR
jgi:hypothetical protein